MAGVANLHFTPCGISTLPFYSPYLFFQIKQTEMRSAGGDSYNTSCPKCHVKLNVLKSDQPPLFGTECTSCGIACEVIHTLERNLKGFILIALCLPNINCLAIQIVFYNVTPHPHQFETSVLLDAGDGMVQCTCTSCSFVMTLLKASFRRIYRYSLTGFVSIGHKGKINGIGLLIFCALFSRFFCSTLYFIDPPI